MQQTICKAIQDKRVIQFTYSGQTRKVEPHTLGLDKKGHTALSGYQLQCIGKPGDKPEWRFYHLNKIADLISTETTFAGARQEYKRGDQRFERVICEL